MAERILSQDEVNALLKGVADGAIPTGAASEGDARGGVRTLDLTSQERSVRGRLPGLELVVDRFVRQLRVALGGFFGQLPGVSVRSLELVKFGGFVERLPQPVSLQLFRLAPLRGLGMLVVGAPLVGGLLEVFFGGTPGRKTNVPAREFSALEQRILERLGARVLQEFRAAWTPVEAIECGLVRCETNPRFASIVGPQDLVLVFDMGIDVEGCEEAGLTLCVPNASLDPLRPRLEASGPGDGDAPDAAWARGLRAALAQAEVELSAELGTHRMPLRAVLGLKVGDLIPLGTGREGPVVVRVAGRPRFLGSPGVSGGNNAVRVTGSV
jgi:flagellar motor switch protein FliM